MNKILSFILVSMSFFQVQAYADGRQDTVDVTHLFLRANEAYMNSDYKSAISDYERIITGNIINGEIYYNLGNAYLKAGDAGNAILNYRKAALLIPRNEDLQANLKYACDLTLDNIVCKEWRSFLDEFCFWYSKLNMYELLKGFLGLNFIFWSLLAVRIFYKGEILKIALYLNIFLLLVFGPSAGLKIYNNYFVKKGVVTSREILVRSGSTVNSTVLFKLHAGAEFIWEQGKNDWVKIRLCDGKKGWVQRKVVGCVMI